MAAQEAVIVRDGDGRPIRSVPTVLSACRAETIRAANRRILAQMGLTVFEPPAGQDVLESLGGPRPDLILLEATTDAGDIEVCRRLRREKQFTGAIGVWVPADFPGARLLEWITSGADVFLPQTSDDVVLVATLKCALRARAAESDVLAAQHEFHQFALHVSHDFQESVRAVTVFSQLIEQSRSGTPGPESEYLGLVLGATQRVRELLDYVLIYAQAAPPASAYGMVDLTSAAQGAVRELKQAIADSQAHVELSPALPTVWGTLAQLQQVLRSLISNAIKYRRPETSAEILIDASQSPAGEWLISVQDNGVGIPSRYRDSIFIPFKRLHGRSIPGCGMGLTVCRKIVEAHGGRIWVESAPGEGSRFLFTLRETPVPL
jgi:signal transduction histidine kinase